MADKQIVNIVPATSPPTLWRHTPKPAPEGEINRGEGMPRRCRRHDGVALVAKRRHMGAGCGSMGLGHWEIFEIEALRSMDCLLFLRS
ncbi:hypothetical protein CDAR_90061 [Caerostris darwini]|uniref:Uncharacterized protein n=1 Tax=Caerostris darwini TaxID=1538125 RepID=A0AAV4QJK3_9ARAC|nr:hypothetical protein CDAR_90061 [Caerostris darwini]